jgi:hypothetical protein
VKELSENTEMRVWVNHGVCTVMETLGIGAQQLIHTVSIDSLRGARVLWLGDDRFNQLNISSINRVNRCG